MVFALRRQWKAYEQLLFIDSKGLFFCHFQMAGQININVLQSLPAREPRRQSIKGVFLNICIFECPNRLLFKINILFLRTR